MSLAAPPRRPLRAATTIGAEVDGRSLTVAVAHGPRVTKVDHVVAASPGAAFAELARRADPTARMVVAWVTPVGAIRQLAVPVVPPDRRRAAIDAVAGKATLSGLFCARLGGPTTDGKEVTAVIGAAPADEVARVFRDTRGAPVDLILAPMLLTADGVWLGVRSAAAEITFVEDGVPRLSRTLGCGGLDQIDGFDPSILDGADRADPAVLRAADGYAESLASHTRETLAFWRRGERIEASTVHVVGRGAALPTLEARLAAVNIAAFGPPDDDVTPRGFTAVEAALADPAQLVGFPDLTAAAHREAVQRAAASSRRVVTTAVVGGAAALGLVLPIGAGRIEHHQADARLASATATLHRLRLQEATYRRVDAAAKAWAATAAAEPDWSATITSILASAPATTHVVNVAIDDTTHPDVVSVTLQAASSDASLADLQQWTASLQGNALVSNVFSTAARGTGFQLQFDIALRGLRTPRPLPGLP